MKNFDEQSFRSDVCNINFEEVFNGNDRCEVWDRLYAKNCQIIDDHCPLQTLRITIGKPKYINDRIHSLMNEWDKAYSVARKLNRFDLWNTARACHSRVAKELRAARRAYKLTQLELAKSDTTKFWHIINGSFFGKLKSQN